MAFSTRTADQIRSGYLRDIRISIPTARTEEGSHEWVRGTAIANALLPVYANGKYLADQAFPDTGDEVTLGRFGKTYSVPRLGDQYAQGTITVRGSYATAIADGSTLANRATGARYRTVGTTSIDAVTLTGIAFVVALQPGSASDALAGTVLAFEGAPPGVDTNATVISISGGDYAWGNARWAIEILKRLRRPALAGNVGHILALSMAIPGVEQAFVYPCLRGSGTLDVVVTTSQASGTRVAGTALLAKVLGALQIGATAPGGVFLGGVPEDVFRNTKVHAVVEEQVDLVVSYEASAANAWEAWPPFGAGYVVPGTQATWYRVAGSPAPGNTSFRIAHPASGPPIDPKKGDLIGAFFPSVGFAKTQITSVVTGAGYWDVTVAAWSPNPSETIAANTPIVPWNAQLVNIAGPPASGSTALTGAVPEYFAALGPGEMTPLTENDLSRRRRWPRTSDTNPVSGEVEWPTDVTSRLVGAILRRTDAPDLSVTVLSPSPSTPTVPAAAHIGTPPRVLVLGDLHVIPTT